MHGGKRTITLINETYIANCDESPNCAPPNSRDLSMECMHRSIALFQLLSFFRRETTRKVEVSTLLHATLRKAGNEAAEMYPITISYCFGLVEQWIGSTMMIRSSLQLHM